MQSAAAQADPTVAAPPFPGELLLAIDRAIDDIEAGRAVVVPLEHAPFFLATLAAILKSRREQELTAAERATLLAWEGAIMSQYTPEDFVLTDEDRANAITVTSEEQLAEALGLA